MTQDHTATVENEKKKKKREKEGRRKKKGIEKKGNWNYLKTNQNINYIILFRIYYGYGNLLYFTLT